MKNEDRIAKVLKRYDKEGPGNRCGLTCDDVKEIAHLASYGDIQGYDTAQAIIFAYEVGFIAGKDHESRRRRKAAKKSAEKTARKGATV